MVGATLLDYSEHVTIAIPLCAILVGAGYYWTQLEYSEKQKPQLIRHFDSILFLKLIRRLSRFWSALTFQGSWLFWSSSSSPIISKKVTALFLHPLLSPPHPNTVLFFFFNFIFSDFVTAIKYQKVKLPKIDFSFFFSSPAPCKIIYVLFSSVFVYVMTDIYIFIYLYLYIYIYI